MTDAKKCAILGAVFYVLMTVVTFGRAWERGNFISGNTGETSMNRFLGSGFAALFWPYYWSTVVWANPQPAVKGSER